MKRLTSMFPFIGEMDNGNLPLGLIIGCVVGGVILLIVVVIVLRCFCCNRRSRMSEALPQITEVSDWYFCFLICVHAVLFYDLNHSGKSR